MEAGQRWANPTPPRCRRCSRKPKPRCTCDLWTGALRPRKRSSTCEEEDWMLSHVARAQRPRPGSGEAPVRGRGRSTFGSSHRRVRGFAFPVMCAFCFLLLLRLLFGSPSVFFSRTKQNGSGPVRSRNNTAENKSTNSGTVPSVLSNWSSTEDTETDSIRHHRFPQARNEENQLPIAQRTRVCSTALLSQCRRPRAGINRLRTTPHTSPPFWWRASAKTAPLTAAAFGRVRPHAVTALRTVMSTNAEGQNVGTLHGVVRDNPEDPHTRTSPR